MKRRSANFIISKQLLRQVLNLPDNCKLLGIEWDFPTDAMRVYIESPDLAEVDDGNIVPTVSPIVTQYVDKNNKVSFTWDWNQNKCIKLEM